MGLTGPVGLWEEKKFGSRRRAFTDVIDEKKDKKKAPRFISLGGRPSAGIGFRRIKKEDLQGEKNQDPALRSRERGGREGKVNPLGVVTNVLRGKSLEGKKSLLGERRNTKHARF